MGREDPQEKEMTHSSILAWEIPWTEESEALHSSDPKCSLSPSLPPAVLPSLPLSLSEPNHQHVHKPRRLRWRMGDHTDESYVHPSQPAPHQLVS